MLMTYATEALQVGLLHELPNLTETEISTSPMMQMSLSELITNAFFFISYLITPFLTSENIQTRLQNLKSMAGYLK